MKSTDDLVAALFAHLRATTTGSRNLLLHTPVTGIADIGELVRALRVAELRGHIRNVGQVLGKWFLDLTASGVEMLGVPATPADARSGRPDSPQPAGTR